MGMLVLSRSIGEKIMIGDDVEIVVVDVRAGNRVRFGITAPTHIPVYRKEIYDKIKRGGGVRHKIRGKGRKT
tara:strand:+ start:5199 stop:5414 length:216 start_codon:yes stop_codon:yes gene_type:complete